MAVLKAVPTDFLKVVTKVGKSVQYLAELKVLKWVGQLAELLAELLAVALALLMAALKAD